MLKFFCLSGLAAALLTLTGGCSPSTQAKSTPLPTEQTASSQPSPSLSPQTNMFEAGLEQASKAAHTTKMAESKEDWELAADRWQTALNSMKAVPPDSQNYAIAQSKLPDYQYRLESAQKRANRTVSLAAPSHTGKALTANASIEEFLDAYFDTVINHGSDGYEYWCSTEAGNRSAFFAPRSWSLLKLQEDSKGRGGTATIQLDASNRGGGQITANWTILISTEKNKSAAKSLPGGWCVSAVIEK